MKAKPEKLPANAKDRWIKETQMFQRIAGVEETSYDELAKDWDSFKNKKFHLKNIETNRIIQDAAINAAKNRRN